MREACEVDDVPRVKVPGDDLPQLLRYAVG